MRQLYLISVFALLFATTIKAQVNTTPNLANLTPAQKSEIWLAYSTTVFNKIIERGFYDSFDSVLVISKIGIKLTHPTDLKKLSEYAYFMGHTYKVQLKYDSAFFYLNKSINLARVSNNKRYETLAIQQINYLYWYVGKSDSTKKYIARLHQLLPQIKDDEVKDRILSALSEDYLNNGYYNKAISYILTSIPIKEKTLAQKKDYASKVSLGLAYVSLGNLYLQLHQNRNALTNFYMAKPYFTNYVGAKVRLCTSFQQVYLNLGMLDSAMHYYKKVYQAMDNYKLYYSSADLSTVNRILASYYLSKDMSLAKKYSTITYQLAVKSENKEAMLHALNLIGNLNYELKNYKSAIIFLEKALPDSYPFSKDVYADINLKLAGSYEKLGNFQKAIKFYKIYNTLSSEISQQKSDEEISKIEFKYKTIQKEKQIGNLSHRAIIANKLLKQQHQLQIALIIAIILAILIAVLIYINYQNKNKANLMLQKANADLDVLNRHLFDANQSKIKLFGIISHDLRKPVSQLFSFLRIQQTKPNFINQLDKEKHQQNLIKSSTNLLDTLEDLLLWSKSQMENFNVEREDIDLPLLFSSVVNFLQAQAEAKNITLVVPEPSFLTFKTDFNLLHTILRNVVQNAISYSFNDTQIFIKAEMDDQHQRTISVINYGELIQPAVVGAIAGASSIKGNSSGYGLLLIKELAEKINAEFSISSDVSNGTEIKLVFKG